MISSKVLSQRQDMANDLTHAVFVCVTGGSASGSEIDTEDELEQARKVTLAGSDDWFQTAFKTIFVKDEF